MDWLDGNWIDIGSFLVAVAYAIWKYSRRNAKRGGLVSKATALDLANGASLFPMLVLAGASFSSKLLAELLTANKLILSIAGLCALLSMLEDDFK